MSEVDRLPNPGVRVPPPLLFAIPWVAGYLLQQTKRIPIVTRNAASQLEIFGWSLIGIWLALTIWAAVAIRNARKATPVEGGTGPSFVTSGPFRYSRNPIYVSLGALYLGMACVLNTLWLVVLFPLAVWLVQRFAIEQQELYLTAVFGKEYEAYATRVRRWI